MSDRLDPGVANEVLRRAAELSAQAADRDTGLERAALTAAASEVGIDAAAIQRALGEYDAGLLAPAPSGGLLGAARVSVSRELGRSATSTWDNVHVWLRGQLLERVERDGNAERWTARTDLKAKVRRKVDTKVTGRVRISDVDAIHVRVAALDGGRSILHLEAAFDNMRRGLMTGVVVVPTAITPVLGVAGAIITGEPTFAIGSLPLAGVMGGFGSLAGRRTLADQREAARLALTSFVDNLP